MKRENKINYNNLQVYHVFHLFIEEGNDENNVDILDHSQGQWNELKKKRGNIWTLPTSLFNNPNFYMNNKYENWTAEDWWQHATGFGYLPKRI